MTLSNADVHRMYGKSSYEELWEKALNAVESGQAGFTLKTGDVHTANDLSGLLGAFDQPTPARRKLRPGTRTTVTVTELDTRLRRSKFGSGLRELLEILTGRPVVTTAERREIFTAELTKAGIVDHPWIDSWLDYCQHPRRVQSIEVRVTAQRCAAILARLVLDPSTYPEEHTPLESLADIYTGDSAGLSPRRLVGQLVMRAVSSAHSKPMPTTTYERWLSWLRAGVIMDDRSTWDVFISHAHEDKTAFVRPLATALREAGLRVWYDEYTMVPGDSIRESIDKGIQRSQAGLLVMSPHFFRKFWTKQEVNGLFSVASSQGTGLIPVLHGLDHEEFTRHSPMLADRYAIRSEVGMDAVVDGVLRAMGKHS
ncbi:TIGR02679 domain-containing protein [Saccharothrix sp. S26]|uniref:TIR domain-containing protein n=1 Tax=Saccharothrix sp. S26 TaxID=2907215 RepID=UPI001F45F77F|nr:TIR domain-containing protein [Saccharothrix sp. S26]MCE7000338.1 TIGR02679 domain-containing protein [Saccharothrix sp. S26]